MRMMGDQIASASAIAIAISALQTWKYIGFGDTPFGIFTNVVDILLSSIMLLAFGVIPAAAISLGYWIARKKDFTVLAKTTFWICFGFTSFALLLSTVKESDSSSVKISGEQFEQPADTKVRLKAGEIVFREAVNKDGTYPQEYFTEEFAPRFAEHMESEFEKLLLNFNLDEERLTSNRAQIGSEGEFLTLKGHKAIVATVSLGPIDGIKTLWSVNIIGNGQSFAVSQQCLGLRESKEEVLNDDCKARFVELISEN